LAEVQGLQPPKHQSDSSGSLPPHKQYVVDCLARMYRAFFRQRGQIDPSRIVDIRYEDLVADPVATLEHIYRSLRLSDFDSVRPVIEQWVAEEHRSYRTNRHRLSDTDEATIRSAWKDYFGAFGYDSCPDE
jgi:hypothetical protein